jgi:hypothetical protein
MGELCQPPRLISTRRPKPSAHYEGDRLRCTLQFGFVNTWQRNNGWLFDVG